MMTGQLLFVLIALFIVGGLASGMLIILLRPLLVRHAMAKPNARSSHRMPTPQGGGIAVVASTLAIVAIASAVMPSGDQGGTWWPVSAAVLVLAAVGWADDVRALSAAPKLASQLIAVALVLYTMPDGLRIVPAVPVGIERAVLWVAGVYLVNIVNFMDGLDWMTVAEVVPVGVGLVVAGLVSDAPPLHTVVAVVLCGAMIGFAPFNRPVATLFLGDVGSLPLGLLLFWLLAELAGRGHVAAALLLPLYYLMDATITLMRRLVRGERIFEAHRTHFYQRATDAGFSVTAIIARVFAVNLLLVGLAVSTVVVASVVWRVVAVALGIAAVTALLVHFSRKQS